MGRAIDMENNIDKILKRIEVIEPALEKVINWIAEKESKDDTKKQRESSTPKKSAKASKKLQDVQQAE